MAVAFGSLYQDDVMIKPNHVVSVLAAAMLLGLDGLIQQCTSVMLETIRYGELLVQAHIMLSWLGKHKVINRML